MNWKNLGIVGLAATSLWAAGASGSSSGSSSSDSSSGSSSKSSAAAVGIGQPASDGKFTFTVNSVKCGIPSVGDTSSGLGATAQGQFCAVNMTVKNTGTEAQEFLASSQYAFNAAGNKLEDSTDAEIWADQAQNVLSSINPGNSITTDVYYDIPTDSSITKFELHDGLFSGGVTVNNK